MSRRRWLPAAAVAAVLGAYALGSVATGPPRFPTREECILAPVEGQPVDLVWGRFDHPLTAGRFADKVVSAGFLGTEALPDGCGRWEVVLEDVPSIEIAREIQQTASTVDLAPTLELASPS